eukprot:5524417-Amphidinium_carterae.1
MMEFQLWSFALVWLMSILRLCIVCVQALVPRNRFGDSGAVALARTIQQQNEAKRSAGLPPLSCTS